MANEYANAFIACGHHVYAVYGRREFIAALRYVLQLFLKPEGEATYRLCLRVCDFLAIAKVATVSNEVLQMDIRLRVCVCVCV